MQWRIRHAQRRQRLSKSLVLVQTSIGDYRQAFLEDLAKRLGVRFRVCAGDDYFDPSMQTRVHVAGGLVRLRNRFMLGRRLMWQSGAIAAASGAGVAVLEFNPRILSVWALLFLRRCQGRPSLLWGHAWSRSGCGSRTEPLRKAMRLFSNGVIVYTPAQQRALSARDGPGRVHMAPNAIYRSGLMQPALSHARDSFLFVGRLVPSKKPDVLLAAFLNARRQLPVGMRMVFVGDGPLLEALRRQAGNSPDAPVQFEGHVADPAALVRLYARALATVSPGPAGLSITQSLGFGVPMLIAQKEPHGPEIEAARDGWNSEWFAPTSIAALENALIKLACGGRENLATPTDISEDCRARYSVEAMVDGFLHAVEAVAPGRPW